MVVWESAWVGVNKTLGIKMHGETVKFIYFPFHPLLNLTILATILHKCMTETSVLDSPNRPYRLWGPLYFLPECIWVKTEETLCGQVLSTAAIRNACCSISIPTYDFRLWFLSTQKTLLIVEVFMWPNN
jgi:hypothetical protein